MNWLEHLSWSHAALLLCCGLFLLTLVCALYAGSPDYDVTDNPHHSCKRNGTQCAGRYE